MKIKRYQRMEKRLREEAVREFDAELDRQMREVFAAAFVANALVGLFWAWCLYARGR
jgi:hypothetical protein